MDKKQIYIELNKSSPGGFFIFWARRDFMSLVEKSKKSLKGDFSGLQDREKKFNYYEMEI